MPRMNGGITVALRWKLEKQGAAGLSVCFGVAIAMRYRVLRVEALVNLDEHKLRFSRMMAAKAGQPEDGSVARAFASVSREMFVGPPPWLLYGGDDDRGVVTSDPSDLYQDVLVQLKSSGAINNGQPSLHALCLAALRIEPGETIVHVGAGAGYYTAILARLSGAQGHVHAYEIDPDLATMCAENLRSLPWATVHPNSGAEGPLPESDVVYVSAGASTPLATWLDALRMGGRLLFPLTPKEGYGGMLLVERREQGYPARFLCGAKFIDCIGARDEDSARRLQACFHRGGMGSVRSLRLHTLPDESAWCLGNGWWLSTDEVT